MARDWIKVKRCRTADCVVIGIAGQGDTPRLVLALRHEDGVLHHAGLTSVIPAEAVAPLAAILDQTVPLEDAIPSRWRYDAIPPWRRVPPDLVCEVRIGPPEPPTPRRLPDTGVAERRPRRRSGDLIPTRALR